MYAAAGGASLASRQARQRQRQQKKTAAAAAKLLPPKVAALAVAEHGASTPTRGPSRQFHQLPTNYLRTPQSQARKLSAGYTAHSKLLLPIEEGDTQSVLHTRMHSHVPPQHHSHSHAHAHQNVPITTYGAHQHQYYQPYSDESGGPLSPKLLHRHSGGSSASFQHAPLPKSATATIPLVSQTVEPTPPTSPAAAAVATPTTAIATATIGVPHHDAIIVTPATPMASPGHVPRLRPPADLDLPETADEKQPLTAGSGAEEESDEAMQPPHAALERKCSVYRMRRSDAFEHQDGIGSMKRQFKELQLNQQTLLQQQQQQQQYEPLPIDEPQMVFKGLSSGRKWQLCAYCEEGICVCEHLECAQGRAAWLERGRRCSVQESQQTQAVVHRRWVKRNRIQDASLGGSSDDEDFLGVLRGPSTFANAFLYVGLGTIALGLVIAFVGTGEKGFKTVELRLIGPSLIGLGLICCILRILFCICPSHCISSKKKTRKKNGNKVDADHTTSLLRGESKRVSIARGHTPQPKYPITHRRSQSRMLNDGMEALRQLATTSLFMQNEQKPPLNRVVPVIKEPDQTIDAALEMKKLVKTLDACEMGEDAEDEEYVKTTTTKTQQQHQPAVTIADTAKQTTRTAVNYKNTKTTKTTTTTTAVDTSKTKTSKALNKQVTITSEPDEISTPCTSRNNYNNKSNNNMQQQQQQQQQQQLALATSSNGAELSASDLLMQETSLMIIEPTTVVTQTTMPTTTATATTAANVQVPITTTTTTMHTGAISRIPTSLTSYDLPPAKPHTYAAARSVERGNSSPLIRGPLGMPLSALTASSSTYAMPCSSAYQQRAKPLPASSSAPAAARTATTPTTKAHHIPGQIIDATILTTTTTTTAETNNSTVNARTPLPATSSHVSFSNGRVQNNSLAPSSKFEPELLLSPAKLGQ